ncbi:MAG: hypothetical protein Q8N63_03685 [Nanoarchaeota archaeon]|nr:hypothetical protein [Nanoarchaeota archaeon]
MTNTQEDIQNRITTLEARAVQCKRELKEARVKLRAEQKQEDISLAQESLEALSQIGVEVSHDHEIGLERIKESYLFHGDNIWYIDRNTRTIVNYLPEQKCFQVREGKREHARLTSGEDYHIKDDYYFDRETVPATNSISRIRRTIGTETLVALVEKAKNAMQDFSRFNSGDHEALTETVAKMIIADRTKKGMQKKISSSALQLKYASLGEDQLDSTFYNLLSYSLSGVFQIPMLDETTNRGLYFCRESDVIIDHYRVIDHCSRTQEGRAILYGSKDNTQKLVELIKGTNRCMNPNRW